jgi:hypothetical protein
MEKAYCTKKRDTNFQKFNEIRKLANSRGMGERAQ